jgi:hypothetical protein
VDDSDTQFLFGQASIATDYQINASAFASHDAVLGDATAVHEAVTFVGVP